MELIKIKKENGKDLVSARELYEFLEVKSRFNDWIKGRIEKYDFIENIDFIAVTEKKVTAQGNNYDYTDYKVITTMAKELCMVENNDKGREARRYFIECEKKLIEQSPRLPTTYKEALLELIRVEEEKELLMLENTQLDNKIKRLVHVNKLYTSTEIAKELGYKSAMQFNEVLKTMGVQFKVNGVWVLTAKYANLGYESIKQNVLDNGKVVYDRKFTQEGRDFILGLFYNGGL